MDKIVWTTVLAGCMALAAFILYLTFTRPDVPVRGFIIAGVILALGLYPLKKLRAAPQSAPTPEQED